MGIIITIVNATVTILSFTVILYTLLRFILNPYHPIISLMGQVIEPILLPIRKFVPPMGGLDFSPLILIIAVQILGSLIVAVLRNFG